MPNPIVTTRPYKIEALVFAYRIGANRSVVFYTNMSLIADIRREKS